jgi:putative cell wall-binding protein
VSTSSASRPAIRPTLIASSLLTAAVLSAGMLGPAGAASAASMDPVCPQATAFRGIDIVPATALPEPDPHASTRISSGALPAGVTLVDGVFSGTPTATGVSMFTIEATYTDFPMKSVACTITVDAAPTPTRIQGTDRYDQAVQVTKSAFPTAPSGGLDVLYLASGEKFSDALSAGSVAGVHGAPLLLTRAATLPAVTKAEIARLAPKTVVIAGGTASVSAGIVDAVKTAVSGVEVKRTAGADRYEVSRGLIADADHGVPTAATVYLAAGATFPDALAASPAAISVNGPVLLVDGTKPAVGDGTLDLLASMRAVTVRIAGGPASVSEGIQEQLGTDLYTVTRAAGADRYQAAVAINHEAFETAKTVYLASGVAFADALSAAPVAGANSAPIYLVQNSCVPAQVLQEIVRVHPKNIVVLGGLSTLSTSIDQLKPC